MKKGLIAAALIILGSAFAADMPTKAQAAEAGSASNWTGFYVGINGGGVWGDATNPSVTDTGPDGFFAAANVPAVLFNGSQSVRNSGGLAGAQIGYLYYQPGSPILGLEIGVDWMGINGSKSNGPTLYPVTAPSAFSWNLKTKSSFLATLLGRVGYNMGTWYPYLTGGLAVATLKYKATYIDTFYPSVSTLSLSQTKPGLALGGGAEWRIAEHWLLRGEYLYMMFDTIKGSGQIACTPGVGNCAPGGNSTTFAYKTNFTENVARLAISYQF
jgi:outer membrane immunogenic protein